MSATPLPPRTRLFAAACIVACLAMVRMWLAPVALGAVFATMLWPQLVALRRRLGRRAAWAPGLLLAATLLGGMLPLAGLAVAVAHAARRLTGARLSGVVQDTQERLVGQLDRLNARLSFVGARVDSDAAREAAADAVRGAAGWAAEAAGEALRSAPEVLVGAFLLLLSMLTCMQVGERLLVALAELLPLSEAQLGRLRHAVHGAVRGAVLGSIVTGAVQALLCLAAMLALQVPGAALWSAVAFPLSFLPMIGTTPVTAGGVLLLLLAERPAAAAAMAVAAVLIGVSDNVVRPWVQGSQSEMNPLVTLVAIFGGLEALGASGVFLGPVLAAVGLWAVALLRRPAADA